MATIHGRGRTIYFKNTDWERAKNILKQWNKKHNLNSSLSELIKKGLEKLSTDL
jgi:hypothetical protein